MISDRKNTMHYKHTDHYIALLSKYLDYRLLSIEHGIIGEGSQILTNQKRENSAFSILIGRNLRPFPDNTVLFTFPDYLITIE